MKNSGLRYKQGWCWFLLNVLHSSNDLYIYIKQTIAQLYLSINANNNLCISHHLPVQNNAICTENSAATFHNNRPPFSVLCTWERSILPETILKIWSSLLSTFFDANPGEGDKLIWAPMLWRLPPIQLADCPRTTSDNERWWGGVLFTKASWWIVYICPQTSQYQNNWPRYWPDGG